MEIKEYITNRNYTKGNNRNIKYIVIHYVGAVSTALNNAKYFHDTYRGASAHYFVDDNEIYKVVNDKDTAWHCGTKGTYYNNCRNSNSVGIEMCCYNNNGTLDMTDNVVNKTIELTKELMAKYNIPVENVVRHYDVTHKCCPAPFVNNINRWNEFKSRLGQATVANNTTVQSTQYTYKDFVGDVQKACGAKVDHIAGPETLSKTVTVSKSKNRKHPVVKSIQKYLYVLGYTEVGNSDGIAGVKFDKAVKHYQKDNGCVVDGEITAHNKTWKKLLKLA